jgi:hypothetical protein
MKRATLIAISLLFLSGAIWYFGVASKPESTSVAASSRPPKSQPSSATNSARNVSQTQQGFALPNFDPLAAIRLKLPLPLGSPESAAVQQLRTLSRKSDIFQAQVEALLTRDPLLFVHSLYLSFPCMYEPVQLKNNSAREHLQSISRDWKTGAPLTVSDEEVRFAELRANSGPQRIYPPEDQREAFAASYRDWERRLSDLAGGMTAPKRDLSEEMRMWSTMQAPLRDSEKLAFEQTRDQLAVSCKGQVIGEAWSAQYRETRDHLAAQGALGALIFNEKAGWTSKRDLSELSQRDFALVERAIREQQPDALALLLTRGVLRHELDQSWTSADAGVINLIGTTQAGWIAACTLGVADCGPTSSEFRSMCLMLGGCDQPDLASLWRSVLVRDGLNEDLINQAVARLLHAIRIGDLEALGVRRAKK